MYSRMMLMVVCWSYRMPFDTDGCVYTLVNVDWIKWMYFRVNEFEVGVNDSIFLVTNSKRCNDRSIQFKQWKVDSRDKIRLVENGLYGRSINDPPEIQLSVGVSDVCVLIFPTSTIFLTSLHETCASWNLNAVSFLRKTIAHCYHSVP